MKFTADQLRKITFPTTSFSGYKKQEVDDFLKHVAQDYDLVEGDYSVIKNKLQFITKEKESILEEFNAKKTAYGKELADKSKEIQELKKQLKHNNKDTNHSASQKRSFENALIIAQEAAAKIEEAAEKEAEKIITDARIKHSEYIKDAKMQQDKIIAEGHREVESIRSEAYKLLAEATSQANEIDKYYDEQMNKLEVEKASVLEDISTEIHSYNRKKQRALDNLTRLQQETEDFRANLLLTYKQALDDLSSEKWTEWSNIIKNSLNSGVDNFEL